MAAAKYTFSIQGDTAASAVESNPLTDEIEASAIVVALEHIDTHGDVLDVWFADDLSAGDETLLTDVVAAHDPTGWSPPSGATRAENFVFVLDNNAPYQRIKKTKWQVIARLRFRGSDDMGLPLAIKAVAWAESGGELWMRIYDATHDAFITSGASTVAAEAAIVDLGAIDNVPEDEAVWELQAKQSGGEGRLQSLSIDYA